MTGSPGPSRAATTNLHCVLEVRTALPSEYDAAGDLVADLYVAAGKTPPR